MAPPSDRPRLNAIDPAALALETAQRMRDHITSQLFHVTAIGQNIQFDVTDDDLRQSEMYHAVRTLAGYARGDHGLDAPVQEYLISLIPLWMAPIGQSDADGIAKDADPDTELGIVICAGVARELIEQGRAVSSAQLAALASLSQRAVQQLVKAEEIPSDKDGVSAKDARRWLAARGVPGFARAKKARA